ncbi:MAG: hypothetical protein AUH13_03605 [Acidobacteria bacterium 13_2_20CM_58_27]|nr:MAG: hypothetical protein AUH13_03605 [Acidobacteria bacterium 13_2_20CM_58_27]
MNIVGPIGLRQGFAILSSVNHPAIILGTSSFTATGRQGSFYPKGLRPADYLSYYAQHFDTVEVDSTFYATPNVNVVRSWNAKPPEGFLFAAKVPELCGDGNYMAKRSGKQCCGAVFHLSNYLSDKSNFF